MRVRYLGHSCFQIEVAGKVLLFDPFISSNQLAAHINIDEVKADYILISHAHHDHVADVVQIAKVNDSTIISNLEVCSWFNTKGLNKIKALNTGGKASFEWGEVKLTPALHSSSFSDGSYGGMAQGFILRMEGKTIYYAGDTALSMEMQLIAKYDKPQLAFLPIGDNFTMGYQDALIACDLIDCKQVVGMHYDTFPPIIIDHDKVKSAFAAAGKHIELMGIGASQDF